MGWRPRLRLLKLYEKRKKINKKRKNIDTEKTSSLKNKEAKANKKNYIYIY
jgi:hypothetical protein